VDDRATWSAAGGVVMTVCATNAVAWLSGTAAAHSPFPTWPVYVFGAMALGGLYVMVAALTRRWPLHRLAVAPAELLDECIRRGHEVRTQLVYDQLDYWAATRIVVGWVYITTMRLGQHFPAIMDEFGAASPGVPISDHASLIGSVNAKLTVLADARKGLGGSR